MLDGHLSSASIVGCLERAGEPIPIDDGGVVESAWCYVLFLCAVVYHLSQQMLLHALISHPVVDYLVLFAHTAALELETAVFVVVIVNALNARNDVLIAAFKVKAFIEIVHKICPLAHISLPVFDFLAAVRPGAVFVLVAVRTADSRNDTVGGTFNLGNAIQLVGIRRVRDGDATELGVQTRTAEFEAEATILAAVVMHRRESTKGGCFSRHDGCLVQRTIIFIHIRPKIARLDKTIRLGSLFDLEAAAAETEPTILKAIVMHRLNSGEDFAAWASECKTLVKVVFVTSGKVVTGIIVDFCLLEVSTSGCEPTILKAVVMNRQNSRENLVFVTTQCKKLVVGGRKSCLASSD